MPLLKFGRSANKAPAAPSNTRRGIVLLDDTDLTRYENNNLLYDTGQSTGQRIVLPLAAGPTRLDTGKLHRDDQARIHETPILSADSTLQDQSVPYHHTNTPMISNKLSVSSVDALPVSHGAIRVGGVVDLISNEYLGLLLNWVLLGFLYGGLDTFLSPFLVKYLRMKGYQITSKIALLDFVWMFKIALAFLSDARPIQRQRRKPYMYIGWGIVLLFMLVMTCMNGVKAYTTNKKAPTEGARYLMPLLFAYFGLLLTTVASEGMMVELAHREGQYARGRTQCVVVMFRYWGEFLGRLLVSVCTNGKDFLGNYGASLPIQAMFGFFGFAAVLGIVFTRYFLTEEANSQPVKAQLSRAWSIVNLRPAWQLMVFGFLCKCALTFDVLERSQIYSVWLGATSLTVNISMAVRAMGGMLAACLVGKLWINVTWRVLVFISVGVGVVFALPIELMTTFDAWRALAVYLLKDQVVNACDAVISLVLELAITEIAEPGYEATTFSVISTVFLLAKPVISMFINASLTAYNLKVDSSKVHWHVAGQQLVKIGLRLVVILAASPLLPRQKTHMKELRAYGSARPFATISFGVVFLLVVISHILALAPSTACLVIAGGAGCS